MHALSTPCAYAGNGALVSRLNLALLVGILQTKQVLFIFCIEPLKIGDEIASGRITVLDQRLFIKIEIFDQVPL
jgi:hypothetical protein